MIRLGLFGGLGLGHVFAAAPIASFNLNNNTIETQTATQPTIRNNPTSQAPASVTQPVIDSSAILASLTPEQRITRLENQVQYLSSSTPDLQALEAQVSTLRGQVEDLKFQVKTLQTEITTLNANTEENSSTVVAGNTANISSTGVSTTSAPEGPSLTKNTVQNTNGFTLTTVKGNTESLPVGAANNTGNLNVASKVGASHMITASSAAMNTAAVPSKEQAAFNQAYALLVKQQYDESTAAFNNFLKVYPSSSLAPDAHYWLGDLYLASGQPDNASDQYKTVINVSNASKRPDAMVKLGTILLAYGDNPNADKLFNEVIQQYPGTSAATSAKGRLNLK